MALSTWAFAAALFWVGQGTNWTALIIALLFTIMGLGIWRKPHYLIDKTGVRNPNTKKDAGTESGIEPGIEVGAEIPWQAVAGIRFISEYRAWRLELWLYAPARYQSYLGEWFNTKPQDGRVPRGTEEAPIVVGVDYWSLRYMWLNINALEATQHITMSKNW